MGSLRNLKTKKIPCYPKAFYNLHGEYFVFECNLSNWDNLLHPSDKSPYFVWQYYVSRFGAHYTDGDIYEYSFRTKMKIRRLLLKLEDLESKNEVD
jgi:hypothetical protein